MPAIFKYPYTVTHHDIDALNHVNNEVYLKWIINAASAHSNHLGWNFQRYLERQQVFVVRRHELDYLAPAYLGEELMIETWIESIEQFKALRFYKITRPKDERFILKAQTLWVYIDLKTGRPVDIPPDVRADFTTAL